MDIKSILSNIFQFAKNNQFRVKLDDTLDLEPIREALADRQNSDELLKSLLVTQNAMLVRDKVEEADKKIEITNKSFEKAKKELNFTREEIEKLDAKVKELNNFKGEKGDSPSLQELRKIIEPLILPPIKGDPGKDYVLTSKDKKEIAKSIKVPIVEKTVETIIEKQPIVTNEIKEVAVTDTSEKIKEKLESLEGDERLDAKAIKNLPKPSFGGGIKRIDGALDTRIIGPTDGQALVWNSSRQVWENSSVSGGSGSPGGSDTQVQFNDGGAFGGDAGLVYNKTTNVLTVGEVIDSGLTESTILSSDGSKQITSLSTATYPSLTELSYLKGVTSAVQTQISAKLSNIVEDTTPQLGGDLDLNNNEIVGTGNIDIVGNVIAEVASGNPTLTNPDNGSGIVMRSGTDSGSYAQLRITQNAGAWADGKSTSYFQIKNNSNNNVVFMGGTYGADVQFDRFQFDSYYTTITDYFYTATPAPNHLFEIINSTAAKAVLKIRAATSQSANIIDINSSSGSGDLLVMDSSGKVGIGVSSPDTVLDINGAITSRELSADPSDPDEGAHVIWQSDGTGSGDDGDIMMKITAGGVTKTVTIVDFSTLS